MPQSIHYLEASDSFCLLKPYFSSTFLPPQANRRVSELSELLAAEEVWGCWKHKLSGGLEAFVRICMYGPFLVAFVGIVFVFFFLGSGSQNCKNGIQLMVYGPFLVLQVSIFGPHFLDRFQGCFLQFSIGKWSPKAFLGWWPIHFNSFLRKQVGHCHILP